MVVRFIIIPLVKSVINGLNLDKVSHFWWKWSKLGHFVGQNDVIIQHFRVGRKDFFLKLSQKLF